VTFYCEEVSEFPRRPLLGFSVNKELSPGPALRAR
jgi:hypothetical protein